MLALVFAFNKFRSFLVGTEVIVFTDHAAITYLLTKTDGKMRLNQWILLLEEFILEINDKEGCEIQIVDHVTLQKSKMFFVEANISVIRSRNYYKVHYNDYKSFRKSRNQNVQENP